MERIREIAERDELYAILDTVRYSASYDARITKLTDGRRGVTVELIERNS